MQVYTVLSVKSCPTERKAARLFREFYPLNNEVACYQNEVSLSLTFFKVEEVCNLGTKCGGIVPQWIELWQESLRGSKKVFKE